MTHQDLIRILVVEDSKTQADIICYYLKNAGYDVIWVDSPVNAFKILSQEVVDLILTDIVMPGMDGYTFCNSLRKDNRFSSIPLIFVTQLSDPKDIIKGLCCGANNFIIKPVRNEQLIHEVAQVIAHKNGFKANNIEEISKITLEYDNHKYSIRSSREDLLRILLSIYQTAVLKNGELENITRDLNDFTLHLEEIVEERTQALSVTNEIVEHLLLQKSELITRIGHDLKTPLTPLYAFLPYLLSKESDPEKKEILSLLVKDVTVLKQLVDSILKLSHIPMDSFYEEKKFADIHLVTLEVLGNLSYQLDQKKITVRNFIRPRTFLSMSRFHVMTVMENLVSNAILYNTEGGLLTITCESEANNWVISVEDTGIGLTSEQASHVFDDFYKADESRHYHHAHGLGLSIVCRIVALYEGFVKVYSPGPGLGSTFRIFLKKPNDLLTQNIAHSGVKNE